jgi:hypothetical protein
MLYSYSGMAAHQIKRPLSLKRHFAHDPIVSLLLAGSQGEAQGKSRGRKNEGKHRQEPLLWFPYKRQHKVA